MKRRNGILAMALGMLALLVGLALSDEGGAGPAAAGPATQEARKADLQYGQIRTLRVAGGGKWDAWSATPVTLDDEGKLLYVSRPPRTQVLDVATGKIIAEIDAGPHGDPGAIALAPKSGRGFISNKSDNTVIVFDLKTRGILGKIAVNGEPGAILYDPMSKRVLVACQIPASVVPFSPDIDLKAGVPDDPIELEGSPSGMIADGQGMVYVNINDKDEVAVIDTREMRVAAAWPVEAWYRPMGIAMDPLRNRLFIGCRSRVVVLSAVDGHQLADIVVAGNDSSVGQGAVAFFDGKFFTSCGDGLLIVVGQSASGTFEVQQRAQIPGEAFGMALDPKTGTFYIPAADAHAPGLRWRGDTGIQLAVVGKK